MVRPSPPSNNPANTDSLAGAVSFVIRKALQETDDMLPAKVLSYNRSTNRARVQIMIPYVTQANEVLQRAIVASVPVFQMGGGGFVVSFPLSAGDLGWIKACDRDISMFKKTYSNSSGPPTQRLHQFADAMFFPDTMLQGVSIAGEDASNLVIQNLAGTVKIALWSAFIKILSRVGIGISPHGSAVFHVASTTKASIPWPLMTLAQRNLIPDPQDGMAVWITDVSNHGLSTYNGITGIWS